MAVFADKAGPALEGLLIATCFLYPFLEWTKYLFNAGLVLCLAVQSLVSPEPSARVQDRRRMGGLMRKAVPDLSIGIMAATVAAGLLFVLYLALVVGLQETLTTMADRGTERSASASGWYFHSLARLFLVYCDSMGMLFPVGIAAAACLIVVGRSIPLPVWLTLAASVIPMAQNDLMANHAIEFPFDRLKLAVPLLLATSLALSLVLKCRCGRDGN